MDVLTHGFETSPDTIFIRRVRDPFGWMGNMSPHPVTTGGLTYRTTEALFQCMRLGLGSPLAEEVRAQRSPMSAKMIAKKHRARFIVAQQSPQDVENMRACVRLKADQHPELLRQLLGTGPRRIVEDCSRRPHGSGTFWGAARQDSGRWQGHNWLGEIWMALRGSRAH